MNGPIKKTIHTELYSDKAYSIILGFYYGLDNWGSKQMARNSNYCCVERAPDNEVVLIIKCSDTTDERANIFAVPITSESECSSQCSVSDTMPYSY